MTKHNQDRVCRCGETNQDNFYMRYGKGRKPCKESRCKACCSKNSKEYRAKDENRERLIAATTVWNAEHKEHRQRYMYQYHRKMIPTLYGLTSEDYEAMLLAQNGVCAICGKPPKANKALAIDHNHTTGKVRALLCTSCNIKLSALEDMRFINYLQKYNG